MMKLVWLGDYEKMDSPKRPIPCVESEMRNNTGNNAETQSEICDSPARMSVCRRVVPCGINIEAIYRKAVNHN